MNKNETKLPEQDAKQGKKGFPVLWVLVCGLALAGIAAIFFAF